MPEQRPEFYVVWADGGGVPTYKHPCYEQAAAEAERLARKMPGREFHVLGWVGTCIKPHDIVWHGQAPLPF